MREQVEPLEDHADLRALRADLPVAQLVELAAMLPVANKLAVDPQPATINLLQVVYVPKRGIAAPRPPHTYPCQPP